MRMLHLFARMRSAAYPHARVYNGRNGLYASDVILVMLAVFVLAYVITFAFSL